MSTLKVGKIVCLFCFNSVSLLLFLVLDLKSFLFEVV